MYKIFLCLLLILAYSCKTRNNINGDSSKIQIVKFMGVEMYATDIDKQMFWSYPDEHMFMYINKEGFVSDIETYREEKRSSLKEYVYAFTTPSKDTLYSDYSLKSWILIRNKKEKYYYDDKGGKVKFLKRTYPFFRDCPYDTENY
jgi:hypothetical protein